MLDLDETNCIGKKTQRYFFLYVVSLPVHYIEGVMIVQSWPKKLAGLSSLCAGNFPAHLLFTTSRPPFYSFERAWLYSKLIRFWKSLYRWKAYSITFVWNHRRANSGINKVDSYTHIIKLYTWNHLKIINTHT